MMHDLPDVEPSLKTAADLVVPDPLDLRFEGFPPDAFALLERLRQHPHIEQYRVEKPAIERDLMAPVRRFRDDLVGNWVLPNRLAFETERNVFSRLLKNDFGAGGAHHHLWMAFYRPGRRRLTDAQLSHSLSPEGFDTGLYLGDYAKDLLAPAKRHILAEPERFLAHVNPLLEQDGWRFYYYYGSGAAKAQPMYEAPLGTLPEDLRKARGLWIRTRFPKETVLAWRERLVEHALEAVRAVWPIYRFYLQPA